MSNKKIMIVALFCGLLTALAMNFYLQKTKESVTHVVTKKVIVSNVKIPAKTVITSEMVGYKELPEEFVHPNAITDIEKVVGCITNSYISAEEQVLRDKLIEKKGSPVGLSYMVPLGTRALSVPVTDVTGVGGLIKPGDRVDVIGTIELEVEKPNTANQTNIMRTKVTHILLQNIEVLAVGSEFRNDEAVKNEANEKVSGTARNVTLAVPVEKMQSLTLMLDHGKVTLALRSPVDESEYNRAPFDDSQFLRK